MISEKWCIRITEDNINEVGRWFDKNVRKKLIEYNGTYTSNLWLNSVYHYPPQRPDSCTSHKQDEKYILISFEDFLKYVINKEEDTIEEPKTEDYSYLEPFLKLIE